MVKWFNKNIILSIIIMLFCLTILKTSAHTALFVKLALYITHENLLTPVLCLYCMSVVLSVLLAVCGQIVTHK